MAMIPTNGLLPKIPGTDTGQVIVDKAVAASDNNYGKIDVTDPLGWLYLLAGKKAKKTGDGWVYEKGKEVPAPPKLGGKYSGGASMDDYSSMLEKHRSIAFRNMLNDALKKYKVSFEPEGDMTRKYGSIGFEYRNESEDAIKIAYDIPVEKKIDVLAHEMAAKDVLGGNRTDGDHEARHGEIIKHAGTIKEAYLRKALEELRN